MAHIQIRNVPEDLHRRLKSRAAAEGMTLSDYLLREIRISADTPTLAEAVERIRSRKLTKLKTRPADLIRADRESH